MNSHYKNMKLTVETNLARFPYTAFTVNPDGSMTTKTWKISSLLEL